MDNSRSQDISLVTTNDIAKKIAVAYIEWLYEVIQASTQGWDRDLHKEFLVVAQHVETCDKFYGLTPMSYLILDRVYDHYYNKHYAELIDVEDVTRKLNSKYGKA